MRWYYGPIVPRMRGHYGPIPLTLLSRSLSKSTNSSFSYCWATVHVHRAYARVRTTLSHSSRLNNVGIGRGLCWRGLWDLVNPDPRTLFLTYFPDCSEDPSVMSQQDDAF